MNNQVLETIKERRSISKFEKYDVSDEEIAAILEAGRWAPSHANIQPWRFVVIRDSEQKRKIAKVAKEITYFYTDVDKASVIVAICVSRDEDPFHHVEAGAAAVQNMALAAQSLGLVSLWAGSLQARRLKRTAEKRLKELLGVPKHHSIAALLPIGKPAQKRKSRRKDLSTIV